MKNEITNIRSKVWSLQLSPDFWLMLVMINHMVNLQNSKWTLTDEEYNCINSRQKWVATNVYN